MKQHNPEGDEIDGFLHAVEEAQKRVFAWVEALVGVVFKRTFEARQRAMKATEDQLPLSRREALAKALDAAPLDDEPLDENERAAMAEVVPPDDLLSLDEYRARRVS